jgi:hypothetical protein
MVSAHMPHCRINALGALGGIVAAGFFAYIRGRLASLAHLFFSTALRGNPPLLLYHLYLHHFTLFPHIAASNLAVRLKDFVAVRTFAQEVPVARAEQLSLIFLQLIINKC